MHQLAINSDRSSLRDYYDYIITGAGAAGLSLVIHLIKSGQSHNKTILLIDKDTKKANDRTWCFWETDPGIFEDIVYRQWNQLNFYSGNLEKKLDILPYSYKLIKGIDFYSYCLEEIRNHHNITFVQATVENISSDEKETYVYAVGKKIKAEYIFNSILFQKPQLKKNQYWLLQHFKGWVIETKHPVFHPASATLMDFRAGQEKGSAFYYMLPFSENKALVEYTLFSPQLLKMSDYDEALATYIQRQLKVQSYRVCEEEFGSIPMTNFNFPKRQNNIIHIGTAGGQTKGSSGYTFRFIQKHSVAIVEGLIKQNNPFAFIKDRKRYSFYDSILLDVLANKRLEGREIFKCLFEKNEAPDVLKFLDNETSLKEDISIIRTLPTLPFLKAALKQWT
jgi:lycopene beta-cyclase